MTEYLNKVVSEDEPWKMVPDTAENILRDLERHTLDPVFEFYGDFVNREPAWLDVKTAAKYAGCASIFGNFLDYSHAFRLVTDDEDLISRISAAVAKNKARPEYAQARKKVMDNLPRLTKKNATPGQIYAFGGGWMRLTRVYRVSEQEANENALYYLDRYEAITSDGHTTGGALTGSDTMPATENWKL